MTPTGERAKAYGAYYTDRIVADFLVHWAVCSSSDTILDPSFGGGVFLEAAAKHLSSISAHPQQVHGVELDPLVHAQTSERLREAYTLSPSSLILSDFFETELLNTFDCVVGNPPFIRYQSFTGEARERALACAEAQGVKLSRLISSWAPFLIRSAACLKAGGRLGMVIPYELAHAAYARPVLEYLCRSFGSVTLLTFLEPLFPDLSQDTLLVLAEDKGAAFRGLYHQDMPGGAETLETLKLNPKRLEHTPLLAGEERLLHAFLPPDTLKLYRRLKEHKRVRKLGDLAEVGIGYVTGANSFFHLSPQEAERWNIPQDYLKPAVFRSRAFRGLSFTQVDWRRASEAGEAGYLLSLEQPDPPDAVQKYLEYGEAQGVPAAYKCRVRTPWYRVPHVYQPDAFLTYMSGLKPQLIANPAEAVAPNTLHVVRLRPDAGVSPTLLSALWQSSLTALSVELEGHAMGGGMLKLEPSEAKRVLVGILEPLQEHEAFLSELNTLMQGDAEEAIKLADRVVLQEHLGLTVEECCALQRAAHTLRTRRYYRQRAA